MLATRTNFTLQALRQLRDPHQFKWYAVTLLVIVIYAYASEVERRRFDVDRRRARRVARGLVQRDRQRPRAAGQRPRGAVDGHRTDGLPGPGRAERRDHVHVRARRHRLREAAARRPRDADPRAAQPSRGRARPVARQRRRGAVPARDRHVPLGVLVVEHALRAADRRPRLPLVLPLRRLGLRRAHATQALDAARRARRPSTWPWAWSSGSASAGCSARRRTSPGRHEPPGPSSAGPVRVRTRTPRRVAGDDWLSIEKTRRRGR